MAFQASASPRAASRGGSPFLRARVFRQIAKIGDYSQSIRAKISFNKERGIENEILEDNDIL